MLESDNKSIQKTAVDIIKKSKDYPTQPPILKTLELIKKFQIP